MPEEFFLFITTRYFSLWSFTLPPSKLLPADRWARLGFNLVADFDFCPQLKKPAPAAI